MQAQVIDEHKVDYEVLCVWLSALRAPLGTRFTSLIMLGQELILVHLVVQFRCMAILMAINTHRLYQPGDLCILMS